MVIYLTLPKPKEVLHCYTTKLNQKKKSWPFWLQETIAREILVLGQLSGALQFISPTISRFKGKED